MLPRNFLGGPIRRPSFLLLPCLPLAPVSTSTQVPCVPSTTHIAILRSTIKGRLPFASLQCDHEKPLANMAHARQDTSTEIWRESNSRPRCQFHTFTCQPGGRTRQFINILGYGQQCLRESQAQPNTTNSGIRSRHRTPQTHPLQPIPPHHIQPFFINSRPIETNSVLKKGFAEGCFQKRSKEGLEEEFKEGF